MGGPVVDWELDKLLEEYGAREKLTPEEEKQLEEDLEKYENEFLMEALKEENEELKEKFEELKEKAVEETNKREMVEEETRQAKEMIKMLEMRLETLNRTRREETSGEACRVVRGRRRRCWNISRPGGCRYGAACRYIHPVAEEVVRATVSNQRLQQGFGQPPSMVRRWRGTMVGGSSTMVRDSCTMVMGQQQPHMWWWETQMKPMMMMNQQSMMNQKIMMSQKRMMMTPTMVHGHQAWGGH